jgi:hypothetical protein
MALFKTIDSIKLESLGESSLAEESPGDIVTKKTLVCALSLGVKLLDKLTGSELSGVGLSSSDKVELMSAAINSELK